MSFRKSNDSNIDLTEDLSAYEGLRDLNKSFRKKKKKNCSSITVAENG